MAWPDDGGGGGSGDDDDDEDDDDDHQSFPLTSFVRFLKKTYVYILSSCWLLNEHDNNAPPVPTDGFSKLLGGGRKIFFPTGWCVFRRTAMASAA